MGGAPSPVSGGCPGCSRRHHWITRVLLPLGLLWVTLGGFSSPLGLYRLSTWPWNEGWFMFGWDSGWEYHLSIEGERPDGRREEIDPSPWFQVRATALGGRIQEVPRDRETMAALAAHLCARVNRGAPPERRISRISVIERAWPRARGRRLESPDVPAGSAYRTVWIDGQRCSEADP